MNSTYFITGISTDVGKTVVSAIVVEALKADYWKPVQAGELSHTDTHKIKDYISNSKTVLHPSSFNLEKAMSPHAAAKIDGVKISVKQIKRPISQNTLVIEGAGGLLVPLNDRETVANLIVPTDKVIVVSRHYLGSINHTLLTIESLKSRGLSIFGIIFIGHEHTSTEKVIAHMAAVPILGRIEQEPYIDKNVVSEYAQRLSKFL